MTISELGFDLTPKEAYVWVWLPDQTAPVVAGVITRQKDKRLSFNYARSYLAKSEGIPIYDAELPLRSGLIAPNDGLTLAGCLRDGAPDAWGRRVILNRLLPKQADRKADRDVDELLFLLQSGSDRIGALDFQASPTNYVARQPKSASLQELLSAAKLVEEGVPLTPELNQALYHGTSLGGARPKAAIEDGNKKYIAKFASSTDTKNIVKFEYVSMRIAALAGLNVANVKLARANEKDVLLVERFDRVHRDGGWARKAMVSALTILGLDEMMARYASYENLATAIRISFVNPHETLRELFGRLVYNVLSGNTDDHARNHAAFWDGRQLSLTPAYDLCPQPRSGGQAGQAMLIHGRNNLSQLSSCLNAAVIFQLKEGEARQIIESQIDAIIQNWPAVIEEAKMSEVDYFGLKGAAFFNPFAFEGFCEQPKLPPYRQ